MVDVTFLDLEIVRRGIVFKIKKGLPLSGHDWVFANDLANREVKSLIFLLDEYVIKMDY